ncbi:hypothetical protein H261_21184 [Paramagnetospirillum caucaseum]|uniref:Uncharacterized protein n=1 Tax=Paramagnetospirillum caucaseum TaxID=1244869 RepID=M3A5Z8_9PROT|nr:hypothetical protein [Paramagnetospirillum caucaseum]EME67904.1 hypothetical protein H261_21184 [Paramagnetospirillum caucaseum]
MTIILTFDKKTMMPNNKNNKADIALNSEKYLSHKMKQRARGQRHQNKMAKEGYRRLVMWVHEDDFREAKDAVKAIIKKSPTRPIYTASKTNRTFSPTTPIAPAHSVDELRAAIEEIVTDRGPIRQDILTTAVARSLGAFKAGQAFKRSVAPLIDGYPATKEGEHTFVWPIGSDTTALHAFRDAAGEDALRSADEIAVQELASLALEFLAEGTSDEAIIRGMATRLGLQSIKHGTRSKLEMALQSAKAHGATRQG